MTVVYNPFSGQGEVVPSFVKETPSGAINGTNATFTTSKPFALGTTQFFLNGLAQSEPQDYNEMSATTVLMVNAPIAGDTLVISYMEA